MNQAELLQILVSNLTELNKTSTQILHELREIRASGGMAIDDSEDEDDDEEGDDEEEVSEDDLEAAAEMVGKITSKLERVGKFMKKRKRGPVAVPEPKQE